MVIYFTSVSNDFRPLGRSVYIAERPNGTEAGGRRLIADRAPCVRRLSEAKRPPDLTFAKLTIRRIRRNGQWKSENLNKSVEIQDLWKLK